MNSTSLIAPKVYNLVWEIEKFASTDKVALKWVDLNGESHQLTYKELYNKVHQYAFTFKNSGIEKGDKLFVMMPRCIETYVVYLAILKIGCVVIPGSEMLKVKDIQYRLEHSEVKAIVSHDEYIGTFSDIAKTGKYKLFTIHNQQNVWTSLNDQAISGAHVLTVETKSDDLAFISYTSGTTGNPKGVVHTHSWGYAHIRTVASNWLDVTEDDTVWATAGPGWQKWIWSPFLATLGSGATGFFYEGKFDADTFLTLLKEQNISVFCSTPTEYRFMAKVENLDQYQLPTLRSAVSAGEPLNQEVIRTFKKHFNVDVRDGYGQTENTLLIGTMKDIKAKVGSMGIPTPGNLVEIVDDEGNPIGVNEVGHIAVHLSSPALFKHYYNDMERTKAQRKGEYYLTGDRAKKDEDGYYWFDGRSDDIIISSGYTIGPFEIEDALVQHKLVKECAVVASPDPLRGNVVKAFVVLTENATNQDDLVSELQEHVKKITAPYKYPRIIEFVQELPKTTSGKIRRVELRAKEQLRESN
ncbi:acyl--CoA ligase [Bacillus sp. AFS088145]|uniref:acyl-CoA synthetase MbcS n=1 Tax=Bacillus sp. AFS088145 TaxID=2033514 RepID=UPI000BF44E19|nr:acyl--CoA ligase [Bacillus sp. AFS088145]PFH91162.1 acyl--CoA ligase [Bacillus sp. AFS088145]